MSDIAQEIKTNIVFNAQQAIRNATELHNALQKISSLDFNNLANAFAQVGNALKLAEKNSTKLGKAIAQSHTEIASAEKKSEQANQKHSDRLKNLATQGNNIINEIEGKKSQGKVFDESDFNAYRQRLANLADKFRDVAPPDIIPRMRQSLIEAFTGAKTVSGFNPIEILQNEQLQSLVSKRNRLIQQMNESDPKKDNSSQSAEFKSINRDILNLCLQAGDAQKAIRLLNDAINDIGNSKAFSEARKQIRQLTSEANKFEKESAKQQSSMESTTNKMSKLIADFKAKKDAGKPFTEKQLTDFRDKFYARGAELGKFSDSDFTPRFREMFAQLVTGIKTHGNFDVSKLLDIGRPELGTNNLLQQRQQLVKQMQDAYSRDRNADLTMDLAKLREINSELSKMYLNFRQLQQAKKIMEDAIAIAGNQSATFGLDKHYKNILSQLNDENARIKQYQYDTDYNGARARTDKYYDRVKALIASANDKNQSLIGVEINQKAKQESNFERLERKLANDVAKIQFEKDSGKTFASYDIDQRIQKLYGYATGMNNIIQGGKAFDGAKLQIFPVVDQIVADLKNGMKIVTGEQLRQQKEQAAKEKEISAQKRADAKLESDREKNLQAEYKARFDLNKKNEKELLDYALKISNIMDKVRNLQNLMDSTLSRGELPTRNFVARFDRLKEQYANDLYKLTNQDYRPFIERIAPKHTGQTKEDDAQLKYTQRTQSSIDKQRAKEEEARRKAEQKARDAEFKQIEDAERNINRIRDAIRNANMTENYFPQAKLDAFNKSLRESISLLLSLGRNQIKPVLDSIVPKVPTVSKESHAALEKSIELKHKLEKMEEKELQSHVQKINSTMDKVRELGAQMNSIIASGENPSQKALDNFNRRRNEYTQQLTDLTGINYKPFVDAILPTAPTKTKESSAREKSDNKAIEKDVKRIEDAWRTVDDIRRKLDSAEIANKLFKTEKIEEFRHKLAEARQDLISFGGEHYGAIFDKLAPKLPTMTQEMANAQKAYYDTQNAINKSIARHEDKIRKEEESKRKAQEKAKQKEHNEDIKLFKEFAKVEEKALRLRDVIESINKRGANVTQEKLDSFELQKASYARQMTKLTVIDYAPILDRFMPKPIVETTERKKVLEEEQKIRAALAKEVAKRTEEEHKAVAKYYQDLNKLEQALLDIRANIDRKNTRGELFSQKELDSYSDSLTKIKDQIRSLVGIDKYNQLYKPVIDSIMPKPMTGTVEAQKAAQAEEAQIQKQIQHLVDLEKLARKAAEIIAKINDRKNAGGFFTEAGINKDRRHLSNIIDDINRIASVDIRPLAMNEFDRAISGVQYKTANGKKIETPTLSNQLQAQLEAARQKAHECAVQLQYNNTIAGQLNFMRALKDLRELEKQVEGVNNRLNNTFTLFNNIGELIGKRMTWYLGDYLAGMVYNLPIDAIDKFRELDQAMAGVQQVMPLIENNQAEINNEMSRFLEISEQYAQEISGVVEAGQLWGRGYGKPVIGTKLQDMMSDDPTFAGITNEMIDYVAQAEAMKTTNELVAQSAILATVDNFSMMESVKGLEAILAAYGLRAQSAAEATLYAGRAVDIVTKVAHYGQISAQDLVRGLEATGAAAADAGVSLEFLSAMIETGTRNTGLSGSNIGNAIKALTAAFDTPKAEAALQEFGVDITQVGDDGKTRLRPLQDIILEISQAIANGDQNARTLIKTLAGGRMQFNKIMSILKDPAEIMRMWGEALDSAGFAEEQLKVQMGTINAHVKQMKTEFESLFQTFMRGGGKSGIIKVVDGITTALKFLEDHMTGIKTAMGAFLLIKFTSWAFGFIGAIKNMITSVRAFSTELQRAGVANSSLGALLKSVVKETFNRVITIQTDNNFSSTQQMKNITEQLKNVENQNTAAKNANTVATNANSTATTANTGTKTANASATAADTTVTTANSTADASNTAAKIGNTAATVANRNATATKIVTTEAATVATNALTAAELRQAAVTTIATMGLNLLVTAVIAGATALSEHIVINETVAEKLDRVGKSTQKEADAVDDEISKLKQEIIARKNCIDYTDKAIEMYLEAADAITKYEKDSEKWVEYSKQMAAAEQGLSDIFGHDAMQRIKDSDNLRDAYDLEKQAYEETTQAKIDKLRELHKKLAEFYKNRGLEAQKEEEYYQVQIDNFGKWTEAQLDGLNLLRQAWMLYHQVMFNWDQNSLKIINESLEKQRRKIKQLDPNGQYFNPYDRRTDTHERRVAAMEKAPPELKTAIATYDYTLSQQKMYQDDAKDHRDTVIEGNGILPFDGIKERLEEARKLNLEVAYEHTRHLLDANESINQMRGIYNSENGGVVDDKDEEGKSKDKKKDVVDYRDEILMSFGASSLQDGVKIPVSILWSLGATISSEGDPWALLNDKRTSNPLGITAAMMQEYYPQGRLGNIFDNARVFNEFIRNHHGSIENMVTVFLEAIFPDLSDEEIKSKVQSTINEAKYLDSILDFKENLDQINPPEKILYNPFSKYTTPSPSNVMQPVYQASDDFSDLLTRTPDPARMWDFLRHHGANENTAAGILGASKYESDGFKAAVENYQNSGATGLFQLLDDRYYDYLNWASQNGFEDPWMALPQLLYVIKVDSPNQQWSASRAGLSDWSLETLNQSGYSAEDIAYYWERDWERPGTANWGQVRDNAKEMLTLYRGRPLPNSNMQAPMMLQAPVAQPIQTTPIDVSNVLTPYRFKVFNQADDRWALEDYMYRDGGSNTFAASACAPMALAMMISGYLENVDPVQVARDLAQYHIYGEGTSGQGIIDVAKKYGLDLHATTNLDEIRQALQAGSGVVAAHGAGEFTRFGHVMFYAGYDAQGNIIVNNPNGGTQKSYAPDFVLNDLLNSGGVAYVLQSPMIPQTVSQTYSQPVELDLSNGYTPQIGDKIYIDQSYETEDKGVIEEGIEGIITAIKENGEAVISFNSDEFNRELSLTEAQLLGEMKVFRGGNVVAGSPNYASNYIPVNQNVVYEDYWSVNKLNRIPTLKNLQLDSLGAYEIERQKRTAEYERVKEQIAHDRKTKGDSAELDQLEITNERKALLTIETDKKILEDMYTQTQEIIDGFLEKHREEIQTKLDIDAGGRSWNDLTSEDQIKIAEAVGSKNISEYIQLQSRIKKDIDETTKKYEQQKRIINELRGVMSDEKVEEWRMNQLQLDYQMQKATDEYGDSYIDRQYQREQIKLLTAQLERQEKELAMANLLSLKRKKDIEEEKKQTQALIDSYRARQSAGQDVTKELDEQIVKLQDLETELEAIDEYGTASQVRARDAVRKTTLEIAQLNQALNATKRREDIDTRHLNKIKGDFDTKQSESPFSDQEATIQYTHQQLDILNRMRSNYEKSLRSARKDSDIRKNSIREKIKSTNQTIGELNNRQLSGEDVASELQLQLQTLRDLNLEYEELATIGTQAEQTLTEKIQNTTAQINELNQSLSRRTLLSRFEDRSLDRLKQNYDEKQAGKLFDDGMDQKEYAREKMQILQQKRARLTGELLVANQEGEIQRDSLLTQLDDAQARVATLEFRVLNGEQVESDLQTQKQILDELKARWEDLSLNGTDAERSIKSELQATNAELKETAREADPVGTKLTQALGDGITNMFSGILLQGESFKDAWKNLWSSIAQIALQQLIMMQLTKWGINSWFSGGGSAADTPVRGVSAGKGKANGGFVGYAEGGLIEDEDLPSFAIGGNILNGGLIRGAGTSTSDSILTYLAHRGRFIRTSNGEYIIKQDTVEKLGVPFLDMLNQNPEAVASLKNYASGGYLGEEMIPEMSQRGQTSYKNFVKSRASVDDRGRRQERLLAEQNALLSRYSQPVNEITNMNINAVDSRSFVQLLSKHSDVIVALLRKEQSRRNRY